MVRPYRPADTDDRAGIRDVFRLTGLFGDPVEQYFPSADFIADAMVEYYLRFEPGWAFVAEEPSTRRIVGYITGCPDTSQRNLRAVTWSSPRLAASFLRHGLLFRWAALRLAFAGLPSLLQDLVRRAPGFDLRRYPAHLHMAVHPAHHRRGIGGTLLRALLGKLAGAGLPGVHLETTNRHAAAIVMYEKNGFREIARHSTRLFDHLVPASMLPIQEILMVKEL